MKDIIVKLVQMSVLGCILTYTIYCWHTEHMAYTHFINKLEYSYKSNLLDSNELSCDLCYTPENYDKDSILRYFSSRPELQRWRIDLKEG